MSTSTNTYAAYADVAAQLPPSYSTTTLPNATLTAICLEASRIIDADLQDKFFPFGDIAAAANATPPVIERLCILKAAERGYEILAVAGRFKPEFWTKALAEKYREGIEDLRNSKTIIPTETTSNETLSWGAEPLEDNEHKFACYPKYVIPGSVVIAGMVNGVDFSVGYSAGYRGSILTKLSDFRNEAGTTVTTISSYDWSYYRNFEIQERPNIFGRLVRA